MPLILDSRFNKYLPKHLVSNHAQEIFEVGSLETALHTMESEISRKVFMEQVLARTDYCNGGNGGIPLGEALPLHRCFNPIIRNYLPEAYLKKVEAH